MSLSSSHPSTFAARSFGSAWNFTATSSAPRTTWKLVTMWPSSSHHEPRSGADGRRRVQSVRRGAPELLVGDECHGGRVLFEQGHRRRLLGVERGARARGNGRDRADRARGSSAERLTSKPAAAATATRAAPANGAAESDGGSFEATRGAATPSASRSVRRGAPFRRGSSRRWTRTARRHLRGTPLEPSRVARRGTPLEEGDTWGRSASDVSKRFRARTARRGAACLAARLGERRGRSERFVRRRRSWYVRA